jgi:hypothetical protein
VEDIEDSIEKYYRNIVADDIDSCLYNTTSKDPDEIQQVYWFNQGLMFASMIARWGLGNDR